MRQMQQNQTGKSCTDIFLSLESVREAGFRMFDLRKTGYIDAELLRYYGSDTLKKWQSRHDFVYVKCLENV